VTLPSLNMSGMAVRSGGSGHSRPNRIFPEQLWISLAARLKLATDNDEFRCRLERCASDLRCDIEAHSVPFPRELKREYRSLRLLLKKLNVTIGQPYLAPAPPAICIVHQLVTAVGEKINLEMFKRDLCLLEEACAALTSSSKLVGNPRGKRYEKRFLRQLNNILDDCRTPLSGRQRAHIAIDMIRWAGGHPASPTSISRYMRHVRKSRNLDCTLV